MDNIASIADLTSYGPGRIQDIYLQFLEKFPLAYQPYVSIAVGALLIYVIYRVIKRDFIFIVALIILVPTSIPVFKSVWSGLATLLKYLFNIT
jgi:hypothetical protein